MANTLKLRPEVAAFAQLMEKKLRENDHKGKKGWVKDGAQKLLVRLCEETAELLESFSAPSLDQPFRALIISAHHVHCAAGALRRFTPTVPREGYIKATPHAVYVDGRTAPASSISEAVDIANFAMMIVDVLGGLKETGT